MTESHFPAQPCGQFSGFSALEDACIRLKVLHPDIPRWLYDLIVEARRLDAAQAFIAGVLSRLQFPLSNAETEQKIDAYITNIVKPDPEIK